MLETGKSFVIGDNAIKYDFKLSLAEVHYKMGEFDECEKTYEEILREQPLHATALNNYAYYLARRGYRLRDAEKYIAKAIELEGENASFTDTYGYIMFADSKYEKAIKYYTKALNEEPKSAEILEHKGDALFKSGNEIEALKFWQLAKTNGGNSNTLLKKIENKKYYEE
ncbi:MAG: tetratricopeptide repeat protein [Bacteroidia bacterium]